MRVFIDTETTRLTPLAGVVTVWELALIVQRDGYFDEYLWRIRTERDCAEESALEVGKYWSRINPVIRDGGAEVVELDPQDGRIVKPLSGREFAAMIVELTSGADLWGSNPAFDMAHLGNLLDVYGEGPGWHYHPNDIPSMAAGWCAANGITPASARGDGRIRSDDWSRALGIDPDSFDRHSALGDARWCREQYRVMADRVAPVLAVGTGEGVELKPGFTSRDQDAGPDGWLPADIADRVADGDPEGLAQVVRVLSCRIADAAAGVTDPRTVLLDLGHAAESLAAAVQAAVRAYGLDDPDLPDVRAAALQAGDGLLEASAGLDELSGTF